MQKACQRQYGLLFRPQDLFLRFLQLPGTGFPNHNIEFKFSIVSILPGSSKGRQISISN